MSNKMIVVGTDDGIILDLNRCVIFDENSLSEADQNLLNFGTETDALSVANRCGVRLSEIVEGCGYGDLSYFNSLSLSPLVLRSEFSALSDSLPDGIDGVEEIKEVLAWGASLEKKMLSDLAAYAMQDDDLWEQWRKTVIESLHDFHTKFITETEKS